MELANEKFLIAKRMLTQYRTDYPNPADESYGLTPPKEKYNRSNRMKGKHKTVTAIRNNKDMYQDLTLSNNQTQKPNSDIHNNASRVDQNNSSKILTEISKSNEPKVLEAWNFNKTLLQTI